MLGQEVQKEADQEPIVTSVTERESTEQILTKLLEKTTKQLFYTRIFAGAAFGLFLVVLITAMVLVPKASRVLSQTNQLVTDAGGILESADLVLQDISAMSNEVTSVSEGLNDFIIENAQTLTDAAQDISNIDFEGLNKAIQDLQDAVGPFANLMNRWK